MSAQERKTNRRTVGNIVRNPFGNYADAYRGEGWYPHPIPFKKKEAPVTGVTGNKSKLPTEIDRLISEWTEGKWAKYNIAIWLQPGIVGIDVDAYKDDGARSLATIEEETGRPLPVTWTSSARRDGVSGIRFYRVPEGLHWPGKVGNGIETIHSGHRYALVAPSVHPEGMCYLWYRPGAPLDGSGQTDPPPVHELSELDEDLIDYFTHHKFSSIVNEKEFGSRAESDREVERWLKAHNNVPEMCSEMLRRLDHCIEEMQSAGRHDTTKDGTFNLVSLAAEGHAGIVAALDQLHDAFIAEISDESREGTARGLHKAEDEWGRQHDAAIKKTMTRQEAGYFEGHPDNCFCGKLTADGRPRPKLPVNSYDLGAVLPEIYEAIAARPETHWDGCYVQSDAVVQLRGGSTQPASVGSLRDVVSLAVECYKPYGEESIPVPAVPPHPLLETLLGSERRRMHLPELRGVSDIPFFAPDENGHAVLYSFNGYHESPGIYLNMDPKLAESVEKIDTAHLSRAIELIEEAVCDFPFVDQASKATFYSALLIPFVRDLIDKSTPLHVIDAPTPGVGKSLLMEVVAYITCGGTSGAEGYHSISVRDGKNRNEELSKHIDASMIAGSRVLVLDNVNGRMDNSHLASGLTQSSYEARPLGGSRLVDVPNRTVWALTGNNVEFSQEIVRRVMYARLDTGTADPARRRKFEHEDLMGWLKEKRPALVWAVLTIVQNWIDKGQPGGKERMGSYNAYIRVVGGILTAAGIGGLLTNEEALAQGSESLGQELKALVIDWFDTYGAEAVLSKDLASLESAYELIPGDFSNRTGKMTQTLKRARDGVVEGFYIRIANRNGYSGFRLEAIDGSTPPEKRRRRRSVQA